MKSQKQNEKGFSFLFVKQKLGRNTGKMLKNIQVTVFTLKEFG